MKNMNPNKKLGKRYWHDHLKRIFCLNNMNRPDKKLEEEKEECEWKGTESISGDTKFQALKTYGYDIVDQDRKLSPIFGRDDEIRSLIKILYRKSKNNPLLIGEPGVGKTTIVKGLAQRIVSSDVPSSLNDVRVISLDVRALVAGTRYKEEVEERLKSVLKEVEDTQRKVILFIDEIHLLFKAAGSTIIFKLMLHSGRLRCIGTTTPEDFRRYIEEEAAFERCFVPVLVVEPSVRCTITILRGLKQIYEAHHGVRILDSALVGAAQLSSRYITGVLPDKAIDLVDEACAEVRVEDNSRPKELEVLEAKRMNLELEFHALEKEKGKASKTRLVEVTKELADLRDEIQPLMMKYEKEKERLYEICMLKEKREVTLQDVKRICEGARVANLKFGDSGMAIQDEWGRGR